VRAKTSALLPFHGGFGNAMLSAVEDIISGVVLWITMYAPLIAFLIILLALIGAVWLLVKFVKTGRKLFQFCKAGVQPSSSR
jgi:Domain of unknown function (DUF4126)